MSEELTIEKLMELMPKAFMPEKAGDLNADVQFHMTGEGGGDWIVHFRDGECTVEQGTTDSARLTLTADAQDYVDIVTGKQSDREIHALEIKRITDLQIVSVEVVTPASIEEVRAVLHCVRE